MKRATLMKFFALGLISALAIGCGDDDPDPAAENPNNTAQEDLGSNQTGDEDMGDEVADAGNNETDTGDNTTDIGNNETDTGNNEECDPEQIAYDLVVSSQDVAAGSVEEVTTEDGVDVVRVDASLGGPAAAAESSWVYVDLTTPAMVMVSDDEALTNGDWDVAFKRADMRLNSGDSGPRPLLVSKVESDFDTAMPPAQDGDWLSDDFVSDECEVSTYGRGTIVTAFGQWYNYDPETRTVTPPENVTYFIYDPVTHAVIQMAVVAWDNGVYDLRVEASGGR